MILDVILDVILASFSILGAEIAGSQGLFQAGWYPALEVTGGHSACTVKCYSRWRFFCTGSSEEARFQGSKVTTVGWFQHI